MFPLSLNRPMQFSTVFIYCILVHFLSIYHGSPIVSQTMSFTPTVLRKAFYTCVEWLNSLVMRASNLLSQTVNKSTVLSLPLDISHNWLLQRTLTECLSNFFTAFLHDGNLAHCWWVQSQYFCYLTDFIPFVIIEFILIFIFSDNTAIPHVYKMQKKLEHGANDNDVSHFGFARFKTSFKYWTNVSWGYIT